LTITPAAEEVIAAFKEVPDSAKLELLLEYADALPELPERYSTQPELFERVEECQSPVFLFTEVSRDKVLVFLTAPVRSSNHQRFCFYPASFARWTKP